MANHALRQYRRKKYKIELARRMRLRKFVRTVDQLGTLDRLLLQNFYSTKHLLPQEEFDAFVVR